MYLWPSRWTLAANDNKSSQRSKKNSGHRADSTEVQRNRSAFISTEKFEIWLHIDNRDKLLDYEAVRLVC